MGHNRAGVRVKKRLRRHKREVARLTLKAATPPGTAAKTETTAAEPAKQ